MTEYLCTACGWEGDRKKRLRGSKAVSVLIWSTLILPGPFYSFWRHTGKDPHCPNCGKVTLVRADSDAGQVAQRRFDLAAGLIAPMQQQTPGELKTFGNDKPAEQSATRKPVNPDEW